MFPLYNIGTSFVFTISNLFAKRTYKVIFYPISNNEILGSTQEITFTTSINGDYVLKTRFYTKAVLTSKHLSYLACELCKKFFYPISRYNSSCLCFETFCESMLILHFFIFVIEFELSWRYLVILQSHWQVFPQWLQQLKHRSIISISILSNMLTNLSV